MKKQKRAGKVIGDEQERFIPVFFLYTKGEAHESGTDQVLHSG